MMRVASSLLVAAVLLAAPATPTAHAADSSRYSGIVVSVDPGAGTMVLEEMGAAQGDRNVVRRRTITLTPQTIYTSVMRVNAPGHYAGEFMEVPLDLGDVWAGAFVTAECVREGKRLVAIRVIQTTLTEPGPAAAGVAGTPPV